LGLFDRIFKRPAAGGGGNRGYWQTLTAYSPVFTSWRGELYESELVRAAIDARARHIAKLAVTVQGSAKPKLQTRLRQAPNEWQTWSQFLYRLSTILDMQNTAFIVPVTGAFGETTGIYPLLPSMCEVVSYDGEPWLRYTFATSQKAAVRMSECGIMTRFQYRDDLFGESNRALSQTMQLMQIQATGITEAVKNSNTFRFFAKINNFVKPEDLAKERRRFNRENLEGEGGGLLLFPNTYSEIKQVVTRPYVIDSGQLELIRTNVYGYFGVNEAVLQNKAIGDAWSAFYEGAIEPFAVQLSEVLTRMLFTPLEQSNGAQLYATANRLQYMSNNDKLNVSAQLVDRGIFSINEAREIFNLPPVEGGDVRTIRGEYKNADAINDPKGDEPNDEPEPGDPDDGDQGAQ
jgi:HK97 family phage portal protein